MPPIEAVEPVQPTPVDQPVPADLAPAETPPAPEPELTDPDLIELREAEAAAEAERTATATPTDGNQANGAAPTATPAEPTPAPPKPRGQPGMVPPARFNEVNARASKAEQEAAYWRGVAEARGGLPASATAPGAATAAPATPEQKLTEIRTAVDALAKKFDDGEMGMADFNKQVRDLTDKEHAVREELLLAKVRPSAPASHKGDLTLEAMTVKLEEEHPWVRPFGELVTDAEWNFVQELAKQNLIDRGIDPANGSIGTYELRRELAELATKLGPVMVGERAKAKGVAVPGLQAPAAAAPAPQARPALSAVAQARAVKLALQAEAPPNLSAITGTTGSVGISDAAIEQLTEEQFLALPASTQKAILSRSSSAP